MEKNIASQVIDSILAAGNHLNALGALSDGIADQQEKVRFRKSLGTVMGILYTDMMMPIIKQYPDLDPDR